jgi:hypothetical protein
MGGVEARNQTLSMSVLETVCGNIHGGLSGTQNARSGWTLSRYG